MKRALEGPRLALFSAAFGAGLWASALAAGEVPFGPQQTITTAADRARSVFAADMDGDGDLDALSASGADDKIAWYENTKGDGSVWAAHTISVLADSAESVFAADIDGDGDLDALSASSADDKIAWYQNDGAGGFGAQRIISTAADSARSVSAADLDGDGDLDVLSASAFDDKIAWYENTVGDGSAWTAHTIAAVANSARSVFVADLDGDGDLDALSASDADDKIAWYENTVGNASAWTAHTISIAADHARSVFAADVDGDGDLDALSASDADNKIAWYENTLGDASAWTAHEISTAASSAQSVFAADVDGDGDLDALSASVFDNKIAWYENSKGDGSAWTARTISTAASFALSVFAADVDGDGDIDALSASNADDRIAWYENETIHRSAEFSGESIITTGADSARSVFAADVDGDGDLDALSASSIVHKIAWYENTAGDGSTWTTHVISLAALDAKSVFAADVDGDGDLDALSASSTDDKIAWYENDGAGGFGAQRIISIAAESARSVFAADVDGDGDLDALSASDLDDKIAWYENTAGDGSVWTEHEISTVADFAQSVFAADVDGDGDLDALSASSLDDKIAWYENTAGDGYAWTERTISTAADQARSVFAADVDGDGDLDVLSASSADDKIAWYENTAGDGSFWTGHTISTAADGPVSVIAVDVDGDGDLDVLSASFADDKIAWYENTAGDGSAWTAHEISTAADFAQSVFAADVDGDGDLDALSASLFDDKIAWYENRGGQFALTTTDVAQQLVANGELHDLLEIVVTHRGRAGDSGVELASLELRLTDGSGAPLAEAEALGLIQELRLYLDDGSGAFDVADVLVSSLGDFSTITANGDGVLTWTMPDDTPTLQVAFGAPKTYYLVAEMTAGAESASPGTFDLEHRTESSSTGEDASADLPLALEPADNVGTAKIDTDLSTASCRAPFDLHLDNRTVASTVLCEAGTVLTAGGSFVVVSPGDLTFRAGEQVILEDGFEVQGGSFTTQQDP